MAAGSIVIATVVGIVMLGGGIAIGYFALPGGGERSSSTINLKSSTYNVTEDYVTKEILKRVDAGKLRSFLKFLSEEPHWAGRSRDEEVLAPFIRDKFLEHGLDSVQMVPYDVLLSYPNASNPNKVTLYDVDNNEVFQAATQEEEVPDIPTNIGPAFHGFGAPGVAKGEPVYVNYGRTEDFDYLESHGIDVTGKVCIARYGKIFRGNKVLNGQLRGAAAVLIYLDPEQAARDGSNVFPKSFWMPGTAMQRGSVMTGNGDPLTPGYPSIDGAFRLDITESNLPIIPSQPIGYDDARKILKLLGGEVAPPEWRGGLNITYHLGPFNAENANKSLVVEVNNKYERVTINNVIGTITGAVEPDRYVLVGNHRDAWGYGAMDPSSGTAQLLELSRVLGELHKEGWNPRRTIVFCSWGAEEYGLIGSTEWVEDNIIKLQNRAVAYMNVDTAVSGDAFRPTASPSLSHLLYPTTQLIQDLDHPGQTLYETWKEYYNARRPTPVEPEPGNTGSGSDNGPFNFYAGIPSIVFSWSSNTLRDNITDYPAYHTAYETFYLVSEIVDPQFNKFKMCTQLDGLLVHTLSDSILLPFDFVHYGKKLQDAYDDLGKNGIIHQLHDNGIDTGFLEREIKAFANVTTQWKNYTTNLIYAESLLIREINDQIIGLEKAFIKPDGLPGRPLVRHVAFAPTEFNQYAGTGFPGLYDLLYGVEKLSPKEQTERWKEVKRHVSDLAVIVRSARRFLDRTYII